MGIGSFAADANSRGYWGHFGTFNPQIVTSIISGNLFYLKLFRATSNIFSEKPN